MLNFDGKCYDSCLYTMKEIDLKWAWEMLRIMVYELDMFDEIEIGKADAMREANQVSDSSISLREY